MPTSSNGNNLYGQIMAKTPGGEVLISCLQCGTCSGSCPSAANMDSSPRQIFARLMAGLDEEVLMSNTPWYCVSCYYCTVRCPQNIPITDLMYTLKQEAISKGQYHKEAHVDWSNSFIGYIEQYGRSFELGLATRYHLTHRPLGMVQKSGLGFDLVRKGRLAIRPDRIRDVSQLTAILKEAKRIAQEEAA